MAGEPELPLAPAPVAAAPAVTPAPVAQPDAAVAAPPPAVTSPEASPPASPQSSAETTPATAAPTTDAKEPGSLLSDAATAPVEAEKPKGDEAKPAADAKPAEAAPAVEIPTPVYEPFTLPEGVSLDGERVGKFTEMLGKFEVATKADHAQVQQLGQQLVEAHIAELKRVEQAGQEAWAKMRDEWKNTFLTDREMGGNRKETTLARCGAMIEQYGGSADQVKELRTAFAMTGMGDHPALIRLLNNIGRALGEGTPVPALNPVSPVKPAKSARRYANSMNGAN